MELDLTYLQQEDRMRLSLRGQTDWLVTRSLLLKQKLAGARSPWHTEEKAAH